VSNALVRSKIEVPSYTRLTKLILDAIKRQKQELAAIIERTLPQEARGVLDGLLAQEPVEGQDTPGKTSAYKLTLMKKLSQSTKPLSKSAWPIWIGFGAFTVNWARRFKPSL